MVVYTILTASIVILWPADALAWGPGTHLEIAASLLRDVAIFSPVVAGLIRRYRDEFIYGMVSADVLVGKKYTGYLHHSHNWKVGWEVLKRCKSDRERTSAYGYLAHLAADIVAHNYYIPYMIIKSYNARMVNHTYWELRFDVHVKRAIWDEVGRVIKGDFDRFDTLLESTLKRPIFSFKTNKRIFSTILLFQKFKQLRQAVEVHSRYSQWPLDRSEVRHYKYLVRKMTRGFLIDLHEAECLKGLPAGLERLEYANRTRKTIKKLVNRGLVKRADLDRFIEMVRERLRETMLRPDADLPQSYLSL